MRLRASTLPDLIAPTEEAAAESQDAGEMTEHARFGQAGCRLRRGGAVGPRCWGYFFQPGFPYAWMLHFGWDCCSDLNATAETFEAETSRDSRLGSPAR